MVETDVWLPFLKDNTILKEGDKVRFPSTGHPGGYRVGYITPKALATMATDQWEKSVIWAAWDSIDGMVLHLPTRNYPNDFVSYCPAFYTKEYSPEQCGDTEEDI